MLHHDDLEIGATVTLGTRTITKDEIIAFARAYDPQPIHIDEAAAKASIVGGLCASGFHTCAFLMRSLVDDMFANATSLGSPGVDEVKWMKPVRPGDRLTARYTCTGKRALGSRPGVGVSQITFELMNQAGDSVMSWASNQFLRMRSGATTLPAAKPAASSKAATPSITSLWDRSDKLPAARTSQYFEDRHVGEIMDLGSHTFARDEIVAFARAFDPQPFHLDEDAAKASLFGGLCASGWHTAAVYVRHNVAFRQTVEAEMRANGVRPAIYGPSPGFRDLKWIKPVFVGDTIAFLARVSELRDLKSRPDRGMMIWDAQGRNQHGDIVFAITGQILVERRTPLTTV